MGGHTLAEHEDAPIAKTMEVQVSRNVAAAAVVTVVGRIIAEREAAPIAETMEVQVSRHVAVAAVAVAQRVLLAIGIAAAEHVEGSGQRVAQIQVVSIHGDPPSACHTTRLLELSVTLRVLQSLQQQPREIPSGLAVVAVESVTC